MLGWTTVVLFVLSEVLALFVAISVWGIGGIIIMLLGPMAPLGVWLLTGFYGPGLCLVCAALLGWVATRLESDD